MTRLNLNNMVGNLIGKVPKKHYMDKAEDYRFIHFFFIAF